MAGGFYNRIPAGRLKQIVVFFSGRNFRECKKQPYFLPPGCTQNDAIKTIMKIIWQSGTEMVTVVAAGVDGIDSSPIVSQIKIVYIMLIEINTDKNIAGSKALKDYYTSTLESALAHFNGKITRVEVHLSDENSSKTGGNDKRCLLEARLAGINPVAVTHQAEEIEHAVSGATDKLIAAIQHALGKQPNY